MVRQGIFQASSQSPATQPRYAPIIDHAKSFLPVPHRKKANVSVVDNKGNRTFALANSFESPSSTKPMHHTSESTCHVEGLIKKMPVSILIDSGASSNIISEEVATLTQLDRIPLDQPIEAEFANSSRAVITESTKVPIELAGQVYSKPSLIGPIGQDLILGTPWLSMNSPVELNIPESITYSTAKGQETLHPLSMEELISVQKRNNNRRKKKKESTSILPISVSELSHYRKSCRIFTVDLKLVLDDPMNLDAPALKEASNKLNPEATYYDTETLESLHPEAQV